MDDWNVEVWVTSVKGERILITLKMPKSFTEEQVERLTSDIFASIRNRFKDWSDVELEMQLVLHGEVFDGTET